jgi:hypothetical protein
MPPPFVGGLALILEKGSDGKFIAKSNSWIKKRVFLRYSSRMRRVVLTMMTAFAAGPAIADRYV